MSKDVEDWDLAVLPNLVRGLFEKQSELVVIAFGMLDSGRSLALWRPEDIAARGLGDNHLAALYYFVRKWRMKGVYWVDNVD